MITACLFLGVVLFERIILIPAGTQIYQIAVLGPVTVGAGIVSVYIILMGAAKLWDPVQGEVTSYRIGIVTTIVCFSLCVFSSVIIIDLGFQSVFLWGSYYVILVSLCILNIVAFSIKPKEKEAVHKKKSDRHPGILAEEGQYADSVFWMKSGEHKLVFGCDSRKCQILFRDRHISRVHCIVQYDEKRDVYKITDYSSNGTYLQNGKRLRYGEPYICKTGTSFRFNQKEIFRLL